MLDARPLVIVAEDDEAILELVVTRLELAGMRTASARSGRRALDLCAELRPAALVLDLGMPEMDGFAVLRELRNGTRPFNGGVLVLTARHAAADVRQAIRLGAGDYLTKPFDDAQLISRVKRLLRNDQAGPRAPTPQQGPVYLD